ncbi:MAG: cupin domain-containing protein [Arenicella sp.]|nr:cupin domain-containing protein [Arenicella sp.]
MKSTEYFFREGCFIEEWHNSARDEDLSIARVRVEPGVSTKLHSLTDTTERYAIISGYAQAEIAGEAKKLGPADVIVIAPGQAQRITNTTSEDLVFLAVCTPRFRLENYRQLEQ